MSSGEQRPIEGEIFPGFDEMTPERVRILESFGLIDEEGKATERAVKQFDEAQERKAKAALTLARQAPPSPDPGPSAPKAAAADPTHETVLGRYQLEAIDWSSPRSLLAIGRALAEVEHQLALARWAKRDASEAAKAAKKKQPGTDPAFRSAARRVIDLDGARSVLLALQAGVTFTLEGRR